MKIEDDQPVTSKVLESFGFERDFEECNGWEINTFWEREGFTLYDHELSKYSSVFMLKFEYKEATGEYLTVPEEIEQKEHDAIIYEFRELESNKITIFHNGDEFESYLKQHLDMIAYIENEVENNPAPFESSIFNESIGHQRRYYLGLFRARLPYIRGILKCLGWTK